MTRNQAHKKNHKFQVTKVFLRTSIYLAWVLNGFLQLGLISDISRKVWAQWNSWSFNESICVFIVRKAEIVTKLILNMSRVSLARVYWSIDLRNQHFTTSIATSQSKTVVHALFSRFEFRTLRYRFSASTKAIHGKPLTQVRYPLVGAHSMFWWHSEYFGGQRKCFRSCGVTITPSSKRIGLNSSHCWTP